MYPDWWHAQYQLETVKAMFLEVSPRLDYSALTIIIFNYIKLRSAASCAVLMPLAIVLLSLKNY